MKPWPFLVAVIMLGGTWGVIESLSYGDSVQSKKDFEEFPLTVAKRWKGKELGLEEKVLKVLKLSDYMMRVYWPAEESENANISKVSQQHHSMPGGGDAQTGPVWLYVGYYESQRTGSTYHSPKNCLPGAGWQFVESEHVTVPMGDGRGQVINRVLIEKGLEQQVILYWYHDRGRVIASEYWAKGYMIWDAITKNRTDGSLVRISIPVTTSSDEAYQHGIHFIQDLWPVLLEFMPDQSIHTV
ncbi:MAG: EpsI family protein [Nitrospirales bacterium]|nr:MAG: EpsI family protein [Nitrospirales bacterium]